MAQTTRTLRTAEDFAGLSFYTICRLADVTRSVDPSKALPARGQVWTLTLDEFGNFVAAEEVR
jgi:hypothetical protein